MGYLTSRMGWAVAATATVLLLAAAPAGAKVSFDRAVTDRIGGSFEALSGAFDGDYVYFSEPGGLHEDTLKQYSVASKQLRTIVTVRGVIGSLRAGGGRVAFSTHRRAGGARGGKVVYTESVLYSMAHGDAAPTALRTTMAKSTVKLLKLRGRTRGRYTTRIVRTCGPLVYAADMSATGRVLAMDQIQSCRGSNYTVNYSAYDPGSTVAVDLGSGGVKSRALLLGGSLVDLGNWNPDTGDRRVLSRDLATGALTPYDAPFWALDLFGAGSHFAVHSWSERGMKIRGKRRPAIVGSIFALGNPKPLTTYRYSPQVEVDSVWFCDDGFVRLRAYPSIYRSQFVFTDFSGKSSEPVVGPRGLGYYVAAAKCAGRTLRVAYVSSEGSTDEFDFPPIKIRDYAF